MTKAHLLPVPTLRRPFLGMLLTAAMATHAADAPPALAMPDRFAPADAATVTMGGDLGQRLTECLENRVMVQDIGAVVKPYAIKSDERDDGWRCEYWGKWYTSLTLGATWQPTPAHLAKVQDGFHALVATAETDGYLGTRTPEHRFRGWDVWGRKYVLLGLVAYWDITHDPAALAAARRHLDALIHDIDSRGIVLAETGYKDWKGLPSCSVLEPVALLYQRTGDPRHLAFANAIIAQWDRPNALTKTGLRLIQDAIAGKPAREVGAHKGYEQMSCFEGLCEMYRIAGDPRHLAACVKLAEAVLRDERLVIGSATSGEIWFDGVRKQTGPTHMPMETCVTATWMKFLYQLLRLTGESRWADELDLSLQNALLAAQMPGGEWWTYFCSLSGERLPSYQQHHEVGLSCCVVNGPRALLLTPFWAFMRAADGPVVNLHAPAAATLATPAGRTVHLAVAGDYPRDGHVVITVTPAQAEEFTLRLRIPAWSASTTLTVNGQTVTATAGSYAGIKRLWQAGDSVVLDLDMRARLIPAPDGNGQVAVQRGPVILAIDERLVPVKPGSLVAFVRGEGDAVTLTPAPDLAGRHGLRMAFTAAVTDTATQGQATIALCDFASAGNRYDATDRYRTWLPQPLDLGKAYDTGITWQKLTHEANKGKPAVPPSRLALLRSPNLALALKGTIVSASSDYPAEAPCVPRLIDGIIPTTTGFTGQRWHSAVDQPHPHWVQLTLAAPAILGRAVLHAADPAGVPVAFTGQVQTDEGGAWTTVFSATTGVATWPATFTFPPVRARAFRLVITASANERFPNAAQLGEIGLFAPADGTTPR